MFTLGYWLNYDISSYCSYKNDINFVLLYKDLQNILLKSRFILTTFSMLPSVSIQFSSVTQSRRTLCDPIDCSTPGLPDHHQLPESTQAHVHWVSDAIQPSYPLLSPSSPAFNLSQHQGLFKGVSSPQQVAKVLEFQPMNTQDWSPLGWTGWNSLQSKGLSRVFSNTTVQKHQFFGTQLSL